MSSPSRLFVLASDMRDVSIAVGRFPLPGATRLGGSALESHGGMGSNQAVQAAPCGAGVTLIATMPPARPRKRCGPPRASTPRVP